MKNGKGSGTGRIGLLLKGKPDEILEAIRILQRKYGRDMPLSYVLSLAGHDRSQPARRSSGGSSGRLRSQEEA
ncbi:hypothetical protein KIH86_26100 [Paenibacillus sp. HN-1]|uniref:hypothetical protein n=1 Tax=Paenibacillus TaxID=44249 RepID=UPI001CA898B3|nr:MULTISPECIES: hypothetical protein [Paenibacillus]MBY9081542.1 hypothetical protein [Paenibacillus sp. CGMCC 1.18879]MBY9087665.1 hypothetical protein [Paenibacillus sinensis]